MINKCDIKNTFNTKKCITRIRLLRVSAPLHFTYVLRTVTEPFCDFEKGRKRGVTSSRLNGRQ